jgi:hypothetical protein
MQTTRRIVFAAGGKRKKVSLRFGPKKSDSIYQLASKDVCGLFHEAINARSDGTLVSQVARDATLVFGAGAANKRRVEDQTVLRGVS